MNKNKNKNKNKNIINDPTSKYFIVQYSKFRRYIHVSSLY